MKATILISGAGQLGSRYLQGLATCRSPLRIYVQDIFEASLDRAKQRWEEVEGLQSQHEVTYHNLFDALPQQVDIAIVATTAEVRPQVIQKIVAHTAVKYWVLEKVLAQSSTAIDEIIAYTAASDGAWVNTPRRMMPWHQQIKPQLGLKQPMTLKVEGGLWGLACNSVHMLDLLTWWSGETLVEVDTAGLDLPWFESKRMGSWEITGTLEGRFSGGSRALLTAKEAIGGLKFELGDGQLSWSIRESDGVAIRSDGLTIPGQVAYQSGMSAALVESLLEKGDCNLPRLAESASMHRVFIDAMLNHWIQHGHPSASAVPIT